MFDKKNVTINWTRLSEVIPNSSQSSARVADERGELVDGSQEEKSSEEKISEEKEALTPHAWLTTPKAFGATTLTSTPGGEFIFLPVFIVIPSRNRRRGI